MKINDFIKGPDGKESSKRLIGVLGGLFFIFIAILGALYFLVTKDSDKFLEVLTAMGYFSSYHLTTGLADNFLRRK